MRTTILLLFLWILTPINAIAETSDCIDFLKELNLKPKELTFQNCKKVDHPPAVVLEATYTVSGKQAKTVEEFLHKEFGLEKLRFVCCGFETRQATYFSNNGDTYSMNMHSYDEYNFQETWQDYKEFRVIIGKYIVLP